MMTSLFRARYVIISCTLTVSVLLCAVPVESTIKCSVCDSSNGNKDCLIHPPKPQLCEGFNYCIAVAKYHVNGLLESFTRSCSPFALPDTCLPGTSRHSLHPTQVCYSTCAKDGCNGSSSVHRVLDLLRRRRKWRHQLLACRLSGGVASHSPSSTISTAQWLAYWNLHTRLFAIF
jgi:hypothetical protein